MSLLSRQRQAARRARRAMHRRWAALKARRWERARSALRVARRYRVKVRELRAERRRRRAEKRRRRGAIYPGSAFTWSEAKAKSWYPVLPPWIKNNVRRHARNLDRLRDEVNEERRRHDLSPTGIRILSWVRSPAKNAAIGGARDSRHKRGDATDIAREEVTRLCPWNPRDFDRIADRVFSDGGFGQYPAGSRHVDSRGYRSRWTSF